MNTKATFLRFLIAFTIVGLFSTASWADDAYDKIKIEAEKYYEEGSYARALKLYEEAEDMELEEADIRWVKYRIGDTMWRNQSATNTNDNTIYVRAQQRLNEVLGEYKLASDRDRLWAATQESLGDFYWNRMNSRNWGSGWQHYSQSLDFWAGERDLDYASVKYLEIVFKAAEPRWLRRYPYYRQSVNVPANILENVVKIAQTDEDISHAKYLLAMATRNAGGAYRHRVQVEELFKFVIGGGKKNEWYDDALYYYAEWLSQVGRLIPGENGNWVSKLAYKDAIVIYKRIVTEFRKGETSYYDQAKARIKEITTPALGVYVSNIFIPDSEVQFNINWRNLNAIDFAIHKVDLTRHVEFPAIDRNLKNWINTIDLALTENVKSWTRETNDTGEHMPGNDMVLLDEKLPTGAYLLIATGGGRTIRELLLVSDATIVMKNVSNQALVYFCDVIDGSPIKGADVTVWEIRREKNDRWVSEKHEAKTDDDGIAVFDFKNDSSWGNLFVAANKKGRQALNQNNTSASPNAARQYRIYAHTDRPAYRPGDSVNWKIITRFYNQSKYSTPANETIRYEITDPRGTKIKEGEMKLNSFGAAWNDLEVTDAMPLGAYIVQFWAKKRNEWIGSSTLFRLEEYKLPEFEVTVSTPEEDGIRKTFQVGDLVEIEINADYYFGAPVANADVEVVVFQKQFWHWWAPVRDVGWLYEDSNPYRWNYWGGQGSEIKREKLKTDENGKAVITIETPLHSNQDYEYTVEARVVDASRREIVGRDTVKVTRQKYFVYPKPEHNLYEPGEKVTANFKVLDANGNPVEAEGVVDVYRDEWKEIWVKPDGSEITSGELLIEKQRHRFFPPRPEPGCIGWRLKFRGYESEKILTQSVKSNRDGDAELTFKPEKEGYYRITWNSEKYDLYPVSAQTAVWVCDDASKNIGYHHGGVDIVVDKDTFKTGETTPVMITAPTNNRYVLFTVEGNDLHSYQLLHIEGTVKLIQLEIREEHEPNVWLNASLVNDGQLYTDVERVTVPPVDHFLTVEVAMNQDAFIPGETGSLTVITKDNDGNPVSAEVALSVIDESLYYIQQELAGDIRQFYFNDRQNLYVSSSSTFNQKAYIRWNKNEKDEIVTVPIDGNGVVHDKLFRNGLDSDEKEKLGMLQSRSRSAGELKMGRSELADASMPGGGGFGGGGFDSAMSSDSARRMSKSNAPSASRVNKNESTQAGEDDTAVRVRSDFRATALWIPDVVTDDNGRSTVIVNFPDSTTRWKTTARAATAGSQFGMGETTAQTRQPLIARLQAPRFFVVGDYTFVSAVINNNTDKIMNTAYGIEVDGLEITGVVIDGRDVAKGTNPVIPIPANGSVKVDWRVAVKSPGKTRVVITAKSGTNSDGMEKVFEIHEHGIEKHIIKSGKVRGNDVTVKIDIPSDRKADSTHLTVQVTPSMAVTMLDALPYLINYPYGCTEQTMSRFLPSAIVAKTLEDLGIDPAVAMSRVFGGIEQQHTDKTQPKGKRDLAELNKMVEAGLARLYDFQHSDGGWGWWKHGNSSHYMSAYVVWGLSLAKEAGIEIDDSTLSKGVNYLRKEIVEEERNYDNQAWILHALASYQYALGDNAKSQYEAKALDNLWKNRDKLNAFTRALLALSVHYYGDHEKAQILVRNLENGVKIDRKPDTSVVMRGKQESHPAVIATAHWGSDGIYYRWSNGGVEATSFVLRALLAIDPDNQLIEPVTNWLIKNRRGAQWSNTRDTAITVLTMTEYLKKSGELDTNIEYELLVNGNSIAKEKVTPAELFTAPSIFHIDPALIIDGQNDIRIVRNQGKGSIYFAIDTEFFSQEEPVEAAGSEIFVRRDYFKLVPYKTLLKGYEYDRIPLKDGDHVRSGERIDVVLTIEAKNDYEYLVFEDLKPAGLEAVQLTSEGNTYAKELNLAGIERRFEDKQGVDAIDISRDSTDYTNRRANAYQELRDRNVAIFFERLSEGVWELKYEMRAEVPGEFHALPVIGHAMYVPEIRCNSREIRMTVYDRER